MVHKWTHCVCGFFVVCSCCLLVLQAQQEQQEQQEHGASYLEVQRLRAQLEVAQGRIRSQELEVERLRALESKLEQNQREQQVSTALQEKIKE